VIIDKPMMNMIASDESNYYIEGLSDDEVLEMYGNDEEYETLEEEIDEIDSGIEELSVRIMIADSEEMEEVVNRLTSEMEVLESEKEDIERLKYELIESSKLKATEDYHDEIEKDITRSPINYFIETGAYNSVDEVITGLGLKFNNLEAAKDIASQGDFSPLNQFSDGYCTEYFDGEDYIVFTDDI
jgi:DNA-directed RNA polymerase beta' subunit